MRYLTIVYRIPDDFGVENLTNHPHASAFALSHKMDECRTLMIENERLKAERNRSGVEMRNAVSKAVREERETWPSLRLVIAWLDAWIERGYGVSELVKELRLYDESMRESGGK